MTGTGRRLWLARALIAWTLAINLQCALLFLWKPERFAPGFEIAGAAGEGMVRGMGLLFVMWNVPYAVALSHPRRQRVSLFEALAMQAIGLVGEMLLLSTFSSSHIMLRITVGRFILFDAIGLIALALATWMVREK